MPAFHLVIPRVMPALKPDMTTRIRDTNTDDTGGLEVTQHLRPDGDHSDEHCERSERGGFLHDSFEHRIPPQNGQGT